MNLSNGILIAASVTCHIFGREIDCLVVDGENIVPIENKSGKNITNSYSNNRKTWYQLTGKNKQQDYIFIWGINPSILAQARLLVGSSWIVFRDFDLHKAFFLREEATKPKRRVQCARVFLAEFQIINLDNN